MCVREFMGKRLHVIYCLLLMHINKYFLLRFFTFHFACLNLGRAATFTQQLVPEPDDTRTCVTLWAGQKKDGDSLRFVRAEAAHLLRRLFALQQEVQARRPLHVHGGPVETPQRFNAHGRMARAPHVRL